MIEFEFDDTKSKSNLEKHGINFQKAQELWEDPDLLEIQVKSDNEPRSIVIGCIAEKHWSAVNYLQKQKHSSDICQAIPHERGRAL